MRTAHVRRAVGTASALLLLPALVAGTTPGTATAAVAAPRAAQAAAGCGTATALTKKLPNGTTWTMCWRISGTKGLVLEKIAYQPRKEPHPIKVLDSAALAQVNVPYDSGLTEYNDLSDIGFGNTAVDIGSDECPGGTIGSAYVPQQERTVKALCATTAPHGYAYRSDVQDERGNAKKYTKQGSDLVVFSVSQLGWYEYVTQWNFSDDGTVTAKVGATGDLSPSDYSGEGTGWPIGKGGHDHATSHYHSVFWRLDFAADGSARSKVEQDDTKTAGRGSGSAVLKTTRTPVAKEMAATSALRRWWRVVSPTAKNTDRHPRSWELVQQHSDHYDAHAYTSKDVYVTQYRACEQLASGNSDPACAGRGTSVDKWANAETLTHPVVWVNVGFHHIPRDEDQTPMPIHWQGFQLVPRDVTAMSPLTPDDLAGHNGRAH
ncbi:copper amine oxidase [Streptomyces sp. NPDC088354]|uniref:copper amine oxidase n=1 Tax=Streptomyces sp. NPDC088354 TaxID=3365856 RepID=UPI00382B85D3